MQRCLMIKTKDKRQFFTHEKNYPLLIEFSKTFGSEMSIVKTQAEVLDISELAPAICDANYNQEIDYEEVKTLTKKSNIKELIKKRLLSGKIVSLKDLKCKSPYYYIQLAIKDLEKKGVRIEKIGVGKYIKHED